MGCWFLCPLDPSGAHEAWLAAARLQFGRHGLAPPEEIRTDTHALLASGSIHPHGGSLCQTDDGFVAVAGTLFYRGQFGARALKALLSDFRSPFDGWGDVVGQFAAVVLKGGRFHVFGDPLGIFNVFESADGRFVSTSFLTMAAVLERLRIDRQSVFEFVFTAGVLGDATPFQEVRRLPAGCQLTLGAARREHTSTPWRWSALPGVAIEDQVDLQACALHRLAETVSNAFGSRVRAPLSGGFDSRLVLAAFRSAGARPHLYVYGDGGSADVRIAREVADGERFSIDHIDKSESASLDLEAFAAHVEHDFHLVDGLSVDGSVFDNGGNAAARLKLQAGATIAASGSGGEIFRNFFHLSDRGYRLKDVVHAFYRQFDSRTATNAFDSGGYDEAVEAKMSAALARIDAPVTRRTIEWLYPAFRCRAHLAREISIVGRYGAYFVPFIEASIAWSALDIPLVAKKHGVFEARLIEKLFPSLSRYRTVYGASTTSVRWRTMIDETATLWRPIWLRRWSYSVKARLHRQTDGHGCMPSRPRLNAVVDPDFPAMRTFFRPQFIRDDGMLRRVALLEYMISRLGSKVALN